MDILHEWVIGPTLRRQAEKRPDSVYVELIDGRRATYGQIDADADRIAVGLQGMGVQPGDRVAIMLRNSLEFVQCWLGVVRLGAVVVPINVALKGDFLEFVLNDCGAAILVTAGEFVPVVEQILPRIKTLHRLIIVGPHSLSAASGTHCLSFEELLAGPARDPGVVVTARDLAAILYTSGTTGRSKGALLPHGHQRLNPHVYIQQLGLTTSDVFYCSLPLFHSNALLLQAYGALILGAKLVLAPSFSASRWLNDIRRHGATVTNLLGAMTEFVWRQPQREDDANNPLRIACVVPIPKSFGEAFQRRFGVEMIELYGTTEVNCPFYMPRGAGLRPGSCGRLVEDWFEVCIADSETDEPVPDGTVGELLVRPKAPWTMMLGYNNAPEATVAAWRNLWFHTGDAFRRESDGYYVFVDRLKDCLRRRGENISSFEVEQVLLSYPGVAEAAVIGVRSPTDENEQEVMAFIVPAPGQTISPPDLSIFCERHMPAFALPRFIEIVPALPKTATQKVRKEVLREAGIGPNTWENPAVGRSRRQQTSDRNEPT